MTAAARTLLLSGLLSLACAPPSLGPDAGRAGTEAGDAGTEAGDAGTDAGDAGTEDAGAGDWRGDGGGPPERAEWRQTGGEAGRSMWSHSQPCSEYVGLWEELIWYEAEGGVQETAALFHSPLIAGDVVIGSNHRHAVALDLATGAERWRLSATDAPGEGVLAGITAVLPLPEIVSVALSSGAQRWRRDDVRAVAALLWDGEGIYVPSEGGRIVALDPANGATRREIPVDAALDSIASCGGRLFAATSDGGVRAWTGTGSTPLWHNTLVPAGADWSHTLRCAGDRIAVLDWSSSRLFVLDAATGDVVLDLSTEGQKRMVLAHGLVALGMDGSGLGLRVLELETGALLWSRPETAWPVAVIGDTLLANLRGSEERQTQSVLLDLMTGQQRGEPLHENLAYDPAIACGKIIGGGRKIVDGVGRASFRVLGAPDVPCQWTAY